MGRKLRRSAPYPFSTSPDTQRESSKNQKEKKGQQKPFLVNHIKIVNRPVNKKSKKNTTNHYQLLDYLFSQMEEQKNLSAELYEKIAQHDSLFNQLLNQKNNPEEKIKNEPPYQNIIDLLNSLHPSTKVNSIVVKDSVIPVDTFINYNPLNQLVYFLRDRNIIIVNATQIHEIDF
jgi:hypothetical protein